MERTILTSLEGEVTSENVQLIKKQLSFAIVKANHIKVCCGNIRKTDLAGFNALVIAHMIAVRADKTLEYVNCTEPKLADFISQTQFGHVFLTH
jgi:anti-anti-sigma regulatory factor